MISYCIPKVLIGDTEAELKDYLAVNIHILQNGIFCYCRNTGELHFVDEGTFKVIPFALSLPTPGNLQIKNIFVDKETRKFVVEYEDIPV